MKNVKIFAAALAMATLLGGLTYAKQDCTCDKQCQLQCAKGENPDCKCKTCDCAKGEGCKHGKCEMKKSK